MHSPHTCPWVTYKTPQSPKILEFGRETVWWRNWHSDAIKLIFNYRILKLWILLVLCMLYCLFGPPRSLKVLIFTKYLHLFSRVPTLWALTVKRTGNMDTSAHLVFVNARKVWTVTNTSNAKTWLLHHYSKRPQVQRQERRKFIF